MSEALMAASVVTVETADLAASLYDLEYRASEDDAWYSVCVVLNAFAETLTARYMCSPEVYEIVFSAGDFRSEAEVEELVGRFRPVSRQLQDNECLKLSIGTTVCAAHGTSDDDLRFYDAVLDDVKHRIHSVADGEEECLCTFVLFWQHGRGRDTLTSVNIASICLIESGSQIDPRISAFGKMAKKKIASLGSPSNGSSNDKKNSCSSIKNYLESSPNRPQELETSKRLKNLTNEIGARIGNSNQWMNQDEDMGPATCNTDDSATTGGHFFIVINNLEKDLTASVIKNFIYEKTTILPEACVFPSQFTDPFARGAIMVDSQQKAQTIQEYLGNPNHLVVSSRGRPWVITKKVSVGTFAASIWNFIRLSREEIKHEGTHRELEVVVSGTESYERAKKFRDLIVEFLHHESVVSKKLLLEEKEISCFYKPPMVS